jgi:integrase
MRPRKRDRHLPACVFHRHGAYYFVKGKVWSPIGKTLKEALAEYERRVNRVDGEMATLIDEALSDRRGKLAKNTWRHYQTTAKYLKRVMAEFNPEDVMPRHVAQIRQKLQHSPGMANRAMSVLRVTFAYAVEQQLVDVDPTLGIKRIEEPKRDRLITLDEFNRIREKSAPGLRVIIDLCYLTGQRIVDVLTIRYVDLVDDGIAFRQGKTKARLVVRWTPELRRAVDTAKQLHGNLRALTLLHGRRGKPPSYSSVREDWAEACKVAGVENAHLHDLRAMAGTAAEAQGLDPQKLLGHTSEANTKRYLRSKAVPVVSGPSIGQVLDYWTERSKQSKA